MAKFKGELPTDILNDIDFVNQNAGHIFGEMTRAGAEHAADTMRRRTNQAFKGGLAEKVNSKLKVTKTYVTKRDKAINTAARYYGYISTDKKPFYLSMKGRKYGPYPGLPVTILMRLKEGGIKSTSMPEPFRKYWKTQKYRIKDPAFDDAMGIEAAMLKTQKKLSKGLLE